MDDPISVQPVAPWLALKVKSYDFFLADIEVPAHKFLVMQLYLSADSCKLPGSSSLVVN